MKKSINIVLILLLMVTVYSCKKNKTDDNPTKTDNYSSVANFLAVNASPMQSYIIDAATGGSFTTPHGTIVSIPANAFETQIGSPVTGNVTIKFKDIYKKSEMLLNDISTNELFGRPIKSAGMFNIKAMQGTEALLLSASKKITITQPLNNLPLDTDMQAFRFKQSAGLKGWFPAMADSAYGVFDTLKDTVTGYIYSFYNFDVPNESGTWCNSDNSTFFSAYPNTILTLHPLDNRNDYSTEMFLIFSTVNSMVHVFYNGSDFKYSYAPLGLQCTAVAVGVKNGLLYSSFTPVTIGSNLTVNFSLSLTTTADFMAQLDALN